jgi:hypothetical protein
MPQCAARQFENELVERLSILANRHLRPPAPAHMMGYSLYGYSLLYWFIREEGAAGDDDVPLCDATAIPTFMLLTFPPRPN